MAGTEVMLRHDFEYKFKKLANPCTEEPRDCLEECPEGTAELQNTINLTQEESGDEALRITTRARQTYELYSFHTNAMLILSQEADREEASGVICRMKTTFENYRFEVEVYFASDPDDLYSKCHQFFGSDFRNHGAVALAIVTSMALNRPGDGGVSVYRQDHMFYKDAIVIQNLEYGRNPTLQGKPKIYISMGDCPFGNDARAPALTAENHSDVLAIQIPLRTHDMMGVEFGNPGMTNFMLKNRFRRGGPIDLLCDKIRDQGENVDMATIMTEVAEEYQSYDLERRRHYRRIPVQTTLNKQLYFVRTDYYYKCILLLSFLMSIMILSQLRW